MSVWNNLLRLVGDVLSLQIFNTRVGWFTESLWNEKGFSQPVLLNKYEKNVDRIMDLFLFILILFSLVLDKWICCFSESFAKPWEKRVFYITLIVIILVLHCVIAVLRDKRIFFTLPILQAEDQREWGCHRTKTKTEGLKTRLELWQKQWSL